MVDWYQCILANGVGAAAFLGGILLTVTTSSLDKDKEHIRPLAAAGTTLFLLVFLLCSGLILLFNFASEYVAERAKHKGHWIYIPLAILSFALQALTLAGSICLFLVIEAFVYKAGRAGVVITSVLAPIAFIFWCVQSFQDCCSVRAKKSRARRRSQTSVVS
jgi:hypothetical protein